MERIIAILTVIGILFGCGSAFAYVPPEVRIEGRDLVVYGPPVEKERHKDVFDSSVDPREVPEKVALALINGDIPEYVPENRSFFRIKKINHRSFPIEEKGEEVIWAYVLNEEGKIEKVENVFPETRQYFPVEFLWRVLVFACLLIVGTANAFSGTRNRKLFVFYVNITAIVIMSASIGEAFDMLVGIFSGTFLGLSGICTGAVAGGFSRSSADLSGSSLVGGFFGFLAGVCAGAISGGFAGGIGGINAGINEYLIFLGFTCTFSFIVSRSLKGLVDRIKLLNKAA